MALETATYIADLNISNPAEGDPVNQGSDHLRLIKSTLKNTFPNLGESAVGFNAEKLTNGALPVGSIIMWSGSTLPTGWALCDGGTYAKMDGSGNIVTPNLSGMFVQAGPLANVKTTGGAASVTPAITVAGASLTVDQLPAHSHGVTDPGHTHTAYQAPHSHGLGNNYFMVDGGPNTNFHGSGSLGNHNSSISIDTQQPDVTVNGNATGVSIQNTGSGNPHVHTATSSAVSTIPPYVILAFIYKL